MEEIRGPRQRSRGSGNRRGLREVYAKSGTKAAIAREIELRKQLGKRRYQDPSEIAYLYASTWATKSKPLPGWKGAAEKAGGLEPVKIVRALEQWHSDPRYIELLKDWACRSEGFLRLNKASNRL